MPKYPPIKYTSRDYTTIKNDLVDHIRRYYPNSYKDFNEASFGSMMLDSVAYIGDILSFYLDYQANESFMDTAVQVDNLIKLGRQNGYKYRSAPSSHGVVTLYILLPANANGMGPNLDYAPALKEGSTFGTLDGNQFILKEAVDFSDTENETVVARVNEKTGVPTYYAVKAYGRVISGAYVEQLIEVGPFEKFLRTRVNGDNVAEIISVHDTAGNEYFEVDYLSQNVVYKSIPNRASDKKDAPAIIKAVPVARRFVVEQLEDEVFLQFGYGSESELTTDSVADPSNVVLNMHGRDHITDDSFDPYKLLSTDKFGVGPASTTLRVVYRVNSVSDVNAGTAALTQVLSPIIEFENVTSLDTEETRVVRRSLEVINEEPITGDLSEPSSEEIKRRSIDVFAEQNRIVTRQDYVSYAYSMPPQFGAIKRCAIHQDKDSFKRNLNLYILSENSARKLVTTSTSIKKNLRVWISKNKMINDTVDILDGRIVNIGIDFVVVGDTQENRFDIVNSCVVALADKFKILPDMGEPFYITDVYKVLRKVRGVVDVVDVQITRKIAGNYSDYRFRIKENMSADGRYIVVPENTVWEIKYPTRDIKGTIR